MSARLLLPAPLHSSWFGLVTAHPEAIQECRIDSIPVYFGLLADKSLVRPFPHTNQLFRGVQSLLGSDGFQCARTPVEHGGAHLHRGSERRVLGTYDIRREAGKKT